jgi:pimeloyl-ACP methyl ester carboxylesterase
VDSVSCGSRCIKFPTIPSQLVAMIACPMRLAFSETDLTEDLKAIAVPFFLAHGDDDQIVPVDATSNYAIAFLQDGTRKVYPGAPHGIFGEFQKNSTRTSWLSSPNNLIAAAADSDANRK